MATDLVAFERSRILSQVIVTNDALADKRKRSAEQEKKIDTESRFQKWRRSDISGRDPVATFVGLASLLIVAFWFFIGGLATVIAYLFRGVMRLLGAIKGGTKSILVPRS